MNSLVNVNANITSASLKPLTKSWKDTLETPNDGSCGHSGVLDLFRMLTNISNDMSAGVSSKNMQEIKLL